MFANVLADVFEQRYPRRYVGRHRAHRRARFVGSAPMPGAGLPHPGTRPPRAAAPATEPEAAGAGEVEQTYEAAEPAETGWVRPDDGDRAAEWVGADDGDDATEWVGADDGDRATE